MHTDLATAVRAWIDDYPALVVRGADVLDTDDLPALLVLVHDLHRPRTRGRGHLPDERGHERGYQSPD